jgi:alpha-mannosidase
MTSEIALILQLPVSLTANRQRRRKTRINCPVMLQVTLRHDSRAVEVRAAIDNRARDHRLRVCFPTGLAADESAAGGHFDVVTRPIEPPDAEGWAQPPVPTRHQRGFVDLSDGRTGLAVFSRGLPEYEVVGSSSGLKTIAVTLLRCVDAISRGDMLSRPSHAGTPSLAPEAQCQGRHEFEYAIRPHAGDWTSVYRDAVTYQVPLYLRRGDETEGYLPDEVWEESSPDVLQGPVTLKVPQLGGDLPGELSFLSLTPDTLVLSAIKRSELLGADGKHALIVRFYNPTPRSAETMLRTFCPIRSAALVNLNEEFMADLPLTTGNALALSVGPKQVRTVALQL